jgi:protein-S-isoprenylcysteine O-methyltransferase Ste14
MKQSKQSLEKRVLMIVLPAVIIIAAFMFIPAWTLDYWQGWLFLLTLFIPMFCVMFYMIKFQRKLLEKRLLVKEKREEQKFIQIINTFIFMIAIIIAVFDHRFGWTNVPVWVVIAADMAMLAGYVFFIRTMLYNEYASRIIEVQKGQKVIDTGPYAVIRHPMYAAGILMYIFIPMVLGSFWGMIPLLLIPVTLIFRILDEEKALIKGLKGYKRYMNKVRYRLFPGVW